jgi:SPX domain protein involved in polyphosphate accumulation
MVMFGAQLENERVEEWAAGYVDYRHLKKVLSELVRSGKSQARSMLIARLAGQRGPNRQAGLRL